LVQNDSKVPLLAVEDISVSYGQVKAVKQASLAVFPGEIVVLIGANGAGKTTLLETILGINTPSSGAIRFMGKDITGNPADRNVRAGLCLAPEGRGVFARLTVAENLKMGAFHRSDKDGIAADLEQMYTLFPRLRERQAQVAGTLSGGEQQMLAIARALMNSPELLLLDEPTEGLAPLIVKSLEEQILKLKEAGISILLSEQNVRSALRMITRAYVIDEGVIRYEGTVAELEANEDVKKKYLMV